MDALILVASFLNLIALGGFFYYVNGWFKSLQNTVEAQKETIEAYKKLLESTDYPQMLERVQAYRKFVDEEKAAFQRDTERKLAEREKQAEGEVLSLTGSFYKLLASLMPLVPPQERKWVMDLRDFSEEQKATLSELSERAPYLPPIVPTGTATISLSLLQSAAQREE